MTAQPPDLDVTVSFGEAAAIGRIERALFGGDAELVSVGRYEIIERIGAGAFGRVYRARDPQLDRTIALKVLEVEGTDDTLGEAKVMATIGHPNVAAIFDAGVLGESVPARVFIAMELVIGRNLRDWLATPRGPGAVLDVLVQVGHGLAAAHAAGIVHRDVKPENVLVGDDGRARVVDFGLARAASARVDPDAPVTSTRTGTAAGTPAYMAPELFDGAPASVASDQFAYCCTLWEALYGTRPYAGTSLEALREAHARTRLDAPRRPRIPRPITRALERGLDPDPAARFPTMAALLAQLALRSRRRWVSAALVGTALVGIGIGVTIARRGGEVAPPCIRPVAELAGVWDEARKRELAAAFRATSDPHAPQSFARAAQLLDRATTAWLDMRADACAATHVRREQSPALLDRRMACLRDWRRRLVALTEGMAKPTLALVAGAPTAAGALPPVASCIAPTDTAPRPTDPALAAVLDELDAKLVEAAVTYAQGDQAAALAAAEHVAREGARLGYEAAQIAALLWQGEALIATGRYDESEAAARACFDLALAARDHRSAALAAGVLAFRGAFDSSLFEESVDWLRTGESLQRKLDGAGDVVAKLAQVEGNVYLTASEPANAKPALERAIAAWRSVDPEHPNQITAIAMLGVAEMNLGNIDAAAAQLRDANERAERDLGPNHPSLAGGLINYGLIELARGSYAAAARAMDRGLELQIATLGERHPLVGYARLNRGQLAVAVGDRERADRELLAAREIVLATYGAEHVITMTIALASSEHFARTGRGELARTHARYALAAPSDDDYGPRALALAVLALAELARGDRAAAHEAALAARTALAEPSAASAPSHRAIVHDLVGEVLHAIGDRDGSIAALRAAAAQTGGPPDALRRARIRYALARVTGDRDLAASVLRELPADIDPALRDAITKLAR